MLAGITAIETCVKRLSQGLISLERGEIKYVPAEGYKLRERASIAITHVYHQLNR